MQLAKLRVVVCEVTVLHPNRLQVMQSFASITYFMMFLLTAALFEFYEGKSTFVFLVKNSRF